MTSETFSLREKIMVIGAPGAGKTYAWLTIAKRYPDAQFFAIDTDDALPRMLSGERFRPLNALTGGNVHWLPAPNWADFSKQIQRATEEAKRGDWIIIDRADKPWPYVQAWFAEEIYGKSPEDYVVMRRKQQKDKKTGETKDRPALVGEFGTGDWVAMNKMSDAWVHLVNYSSPANIYATTPPKKLTEYDNTLTRMLFGPFGFRPAGRQGLAHEFETVLIMAYTRHGTHKFYGEEMPGSWELTTVKDRERPMLDGEELKDFGLQYIRKIAKVK